MILDKLKPTDLPQLDGICDSDDSDDISQLDGNDDGMFLIYINVIIVIIL